MEEIFLPYPDDLIRLINNSRRLIKTVLNGGKLMGTSGLMTRKEAAEYLGTTPGTLAVWACKKSKKIPFIRLEGNTIRYLKTDLDKYLEQNTVNKPE